MRCVASSSARNSAASFKQNPGRVLDHGRTPPSQPNPWLTFLVAIHHSQPILSLLLGLPLPVFLPSCGCGFGIDARPAPSFTPKEDTAYQPQQQPGQPNNLATHTLVYRPCLRLREARVTGVTCASATIPLLTRPPPASSPAPCSPRAAGSIHGSSDHFSVRTTGGVKTAGRRLGDGGSGGGGGGGGARAYFSGGGRGGAAGGASRSARGERRRRGYDIVVLDECSQIVEPMSLLPIAAAQPRRLVLVGDPMQLPPPVSHVKV